MRETKQMLCEKEKRASHSLLLAAGYEEGDHVTF